MSRYIDADAIEKRRMDYILDGHAESVADMTEWGMALIEAPSIDIVRCKECKHNQGGTCEYAEWNCKPDDFCNYGEPKGEE